MPDTADVHPPVSPVESKTQTSNMDHIIPAQIQERSILQIFEQKNNIWPDKQTQANMFCIIKKKVMKPKYSEISDPHTGLHNKH